MKKRKEKKRKEFWPVADDDNKMYFLNVDSFRLYADNTKFNRQLTLMLICNIAQLNY